MEPGRRCVSPPASEHDALRPPLTPGEREVFACFTESLDPAWEIYVQPYLNGLRPDFVLLNPSVGIAVFEVKDWNLDAMVYERAAEGGDAHLTVHDGRRSFRKESPVAQVQRYRREIAHLYLPSLGTGNAIAAVTGGVIFTAARDRHVHDLLTPATSHLNQAQAQYVPISGRDALRARDLSTLFPESSRSMSRIMKPEFAEELRRWLREPTHASEQRKPLMLDSQQRQMAETRTETGFRRIRGPAGSGKSSVLAARAALLAQERKRVLVVSYNHTLRTYLRTLTDRAGGRASEVTWLGFHEWCRRTMQESGRSGAYDALAARLASNEKSVLDEELPQQTLDALRSGPLRESVTRYDAILVDEGQDFRPSWWEALKAVRSPGGEMLLVADRAQDIYKTGGAWTEDVMRGAGFRGDWVELRTSYRMPPG
jgi:hypothetical protein